MFLQGFVKDTNGCRGLIHYALVWHMERDQGVMMRFTKIIWEIPP